MLEHIFSISDQMALVLNRCSRCGREIPVEEVGYFSLNYVTDRFDLECNFCYDGSKRYEPIELA